MIDEKAIPKAYITPTMKTSDQDLLGICAAWFEESRRYHTQLEKVWKKNEEYYKGLQTEMDKIPKDMSNTVQNQIFMGVETVIPIVTANSPHFIVQPPEESDVSVTYAEAVQKVLGVHYELVDVRSKAEMLIRHMLVYRLGVWKIFWDDKTNDVGLKSVRPQRIYFPKVSGELPYIMEQVDISSEEFREVFGDDKFKEFLINGGQEFDPNQLNKVSGVWTIWEISTKDLRFWKYGSMIIKKEENSYYNFKNKKANHLEFPQIPYIIASIFRLGNEPIGETDLIQQCIPIQDAINVASRLIINNALKTGNSQWFIDSSVMSEEEANTKISNAVGLIVYGEGVANPSLVRRDAPPPMPNYIENLKISQERAFDNIFGTHSTTRGERGKEETLGGRLLLKQADIGRIDLIVREYERCIALLGNWFTQLMKINYKNKRSFREYGEAGITFVNLIPEMIETGIKIIIKSGTTLPTDEMSKRNEAIQLYSMGALDPTTLFERLKFPNPEEAAERLQAWRTGQLKEQAEMGALQGGGAGQAPGRQVKPMPSGAKSIKQQQNKL